MFIKVMAKVAVEPVDLFSLERLCLKAVAENVALRCKNQRKNGALPYSDITFSQLG